MGLSEGDALVGESNIPLFHAVDVEGPSLEPAVVSVSRVNCIVRFFSEKFRIALDKYFNHEIEIGSPEKNRFSHDEFLENWRAMKFVLMRIISNRFSCKCLGNYDWPWVFNQCIVGGIGFEFNTRVDKNSIAWNDGKVLVMVANDCCGISVADKAKKLNFSF